MSWIEEFANQLYHYLFEGEGKQKNPLKVETMRTEAERTIEHELPRIADSLETIAEEMQDD